MKLRLGVLALIALAPSARAQGPFANVRSYLHASVLEQPRGLRNVGMGTSGVSDMHNKTNGYYNPASLAFNDREWLSFEYQEFARDINAELTYTDTRFCFGHQFGDSLPNSWRVGGVLGYSTNDVESEARTIFLPEGTGSISEWHDYYITAGWGACYQQGRETFAIGASLKYLEIDYSGASSWLFDYGVLAALTYSINGSTLRPRVGISSLNHDSGIEIDSTDYDIIGHWRMGGGVDLASTKGALWGREVVTAGASIDFERVSVDEARGPYWAIGFEGSMFELVHLRAGYQWYEVENRTTVCVGGGLGWEFRSIAVLFDYARYSPGGSGFFDQDMFGTSVGARF